MALDRVLYSRAGAVLDRFPAETDWSENIPGTIGEGVAKDACFFAPQDMSKRRQVNRSTSEELRRQIPADHLFDYLAISMGYREGGSDAIYYYNRAFYYAEAFDCGKKFDGSGQQATREDPENGSSSITWQNFDYAMCNSIKEATFRQRAALKAYFLEEREPIPAIEEVIASARKKMPWPTVGKPKGPNAQVPRRSRKKR